MTEVCLTRDIAWLICQHIKDSIAWCRFAQVSRGARRACKEALIPIDLVGGYTLPAWSDNRIRIILHGFRENSYERGWYVNGKKHGHYVNRDESVQYRYGSFIYGWQFQYKKSGRRGYARERARVLSSFAVKSHGRLWKQGKDLTGETRELWIYGQLVDQVKWDRRRRMIIKPKSERWHFILFDDSYWNLAYGHTFKPLPEGWDVELHID